MALLSHALSSQPLFETRRHQPRRRVRIIELKCEVCNDRFGDLDIFNRHIKMCGIVEVVKIAPVPSVKYKKLAIPPILRTQIWHKYMGNVAEAKCYCCNFIMISITNFHGAHVIAESLGGRLTVGNIRPTCKSCNSSMRNTCMRAYCRLYYPNAPMAKESDNI